MKRFVITAALATAATSIVIGSPVNAGKQAEKSGPTGVLQLVQHDRSVDIDNSRRRAISAGDEFALRGLLYDQRDQNRVGRTHGHCVITIANRRQLSFHCNETYSLANGQIAVQGSLTITRRSDSTVVPIVGGTGAYEGADGSLTVTNRPADQSALEFKFAG
jgi:hypothetical protein